ncbi:class I SAM-dependent methyltransferase [Draconibacterium halophilum]|uniref:methyltransferase domain-containing protein n=1 Tax=Draconibacterium halophilum TaxID=2706887 RepID=UPI00193FFC22|nr:methyltransferase domain-containing protein [Draconibacterium halophilum]
MISQFPKSRIQLPEEIKAVYDLHYKSNREGNTAASGLAQMMEAWMHKKVAADVKPIHEKRTLEIGAGTLNQLCYEKSSHYDIVEPYDKLYQNSQYLSSINKVYNDIREVESTNKYDRITSIATFEHILDLPAVVAKTCLLLASKGTLRTSIPNEGTPLWTMGWRLTTGLEFYLKYRVDYGILMKYEHVNSAKEIEDVLSYFYNINECDVLGLNKAVGFYRSYVSKEPKVEVAKDYLDSINEAKRS